MAGDKPQIVARLCISDRTRTLIAVRRASCPGRQRRELPDPLAAKPPRSGPAGLTEVSPCRTVLHARWTSQASAGSRRIALPGWNTSCSRVATRRAPDPDGQRSRVTRRQAHGTSDPVRAVADGVSSGTGGRGAERAPDARDGSDRVLPRQPALPLRPARRAQPSATMPTSRSRSGSDARWRAAASEQRARLRNLGDFSLFMSGFFPDSFRRRVVDVDYYVSMGEYAYGSLSRRDAGRVRRGVRRAGA